MQPKKKDKFFSKTTKAHSKKVQLWIWNKAEFNTELNNTTYATKVMIKNACMKLLFVIVLIILYPLESAVCQSCCIRVAW